MEGGAAVALIVHSAAVDGLYFHREVARQLFASIFSAVYDTILEKCSTGRVARTGRWGSVELRWR